jgi:hypothetical protein
VRVSPPSTSRSIRRTLSGVLLVGFLAHAGDGLVALMCDPGMEHGHAHEEAADPAAGSGHGGHEQPEGHAPEPVLPPAPSEGGGGVPNHGEAPCPLGSGVMAFCGGAATVPTPSFADAPRAPFGDAPAIPDATHALGTLLSLKFFRPPRA